MSKIDKMLLDFPPSVRAKFIDHIEGRTSANWLSDWCRRAGYDIGSSTIKDYRKKHYG